MIILKLKTMIANYSSFLEFIAAVYCTIWIDNIIAQKVWTPKYIDSLRKAIEGIQFAGNTSLSTEIIESNTERGNELQLRLLLSGKPFPHIKVKG